MCEKDPSNYDSVWKSVAVFIVTDGKKNLNRTTAT
jgi:hypothetical protein